MTDLPWEQNKKTGKNKDGSSETVEFPWEQGDNEPKKDISADIFNSAFEEQPLQEVSLEDIPDDEDEIEDLNDLQFNEIQDISDPSQFEEGEEPPFLDVAKVAAESKGKNEIERPPFEIDSGDEDINNFAPPSFEGIPDISNLSSDEEQGAVPEQEKHDIPPFLDVTKSSPQKEKLPFTNENNETESVDNEVPTLDFNLDKNVEIPDFQKDNELFDQTELESIDLESSNSFIEDDIKTEFEKIDTPIIPQKDSSENNTEIEMDEAQSSSFEFQKSDNKNNIEDPVETIKRIREQLLENRRMRESKDYSVQSLDDEDSSISAEIPFDEGQFGSDDKETLRPKTTSKTMDEVNEPSSVPTNHTQFESMGSGMQDKPETGNVKETNKKQYQVPVSSSVQHETEPSPFIPPVQGLSTKGTSPDVGLNETDNMSNTNFETPFQEKTPDDFDPFSDEDFFGGGIDEDDGIPQTKQSSVSMVMNKASSFFKKMVQGLSRGGSLKDRMDDISSDLNRDKESPFLEEDPFQDEIEKNKDDTDIFSTPFEEHDPKDHTDEPETFQHKGLDLEEIDDNDTSFEFKPNESEPVPDIQNNKTPIEVETDESDTITGIQKSKESDISESVTIDERTEDHSKSKISHEDETNVELTGKDSELDELRQNITDLRSSVNDISQMDSKLESFKSDIVEIVNTELNSSTKRTNEISQEIERIKENVQQFREENESNKKNLLLLGDSIQELKESQEKLMQSVQDTYTNFDTDIQELKSKVTKLDQIDEIEECVAEINQKNEDMEKVFDDLGANVTTILNELSQAYDSNEELRTNISTDISQLYKEMNKFTQHVNSELRKIGGRGYSFSNNNTNNNVYLSHIQKNSTNIKLCLEWVLILMKMVGRNNIGSILSYYEELGWISTDVKLELLKYAESINYYENKDHWKLNPEDHLRSIWFIERLAGVKIDKNRLSIVDKDIEKVKKGTEIYGI